MSAPSAIPPSTAAAGQAQAQMHRPHETKGKGKASASEVVLGADETDPEDYNIRSVERTELLIELKDLIGNTGVSPALWACCQLCDKRRLPVLINLASVDPDSLLGYERPLVSVPMLCKLLVLRPYYGFDCRYAHG